jgi:threonine/homoserine/homoserine lactone efflux protein
MIDPTVLPAFLVATTLVVVAPGPDNTYIAAVAVAQGARSGVLSAAGMALGMVVHVTAAALGLAVVLRSTPWALEVIRIAGAGYLCWLAWSAFRRRRDSESGSLSPSTAPVVLRRAVLTNLTNPKIVLFFAAFLPQFVRRGHGPVAAQVLVLGLLFLVVGLVSDSVIGVVVGRLGGAAGASGRATRAVNLAAALTFAGLAGVMILEALQPAYGG